MSPKTHEIISIGHVSLLNGSRLNQTVVFYLDQQYILTQPNSDMLQKMNVRGRRRRKMKAEERRNEKKKKVRK